MLLIKGITYQDIENMPSFERQYFYEGAIEVYTNDKGEIVVT